MGHTKVPDSTVDQTVVTDLSMYWGSKKVQDRVDADRRTMELAWRDEMERCSQSQKLSNVCDSIYTREKEVKENPAIQQQQQQQ
jgi:hypothetical protein